MMNELGNLLPSGFPNGLRVLLVQDDETCIQVMEEMLKSWNYQVTICRRANEALSILQEKKENYDIVISDLQINDMDGLKFLEMVKLQINLPIVITGDESHDVIMEGIIKGACDYLVKPIREDALRHIWQHVVRNKTKELKELDELKLRENNGESQFLKSNDVEEISTNKDAADTNDNMKRRLDGDEEYESENCDDVMRSKKSRLVWTEELHQMFITAVNELGVDSAVPKKILQSMHRMGISYITRENIASHLQKHRMYIKRAEYTSSVGPNEHFFRQSYALNEISKPQACASSSQVPIASPRVSQENQFNVNSALFGYDHINQFDKRVVFSGYEMDQQFNKNEALQGNLGHGYSNSIDIRHQLMASSKQQEEGLFLGHAGHVGRTGSQSHRDLTLTSLGTEINNPIYDHSNQSYTLNEIEIEMKNKMLCDAIENEACGCQMYYQSPTNRAHDQDHAFVRNNHGVVTCYPNMEMSRHGFSLHHANSIENMVDKNESPISNFSLMEDHDFGNLGSNAQHFNKNLFENQGEYHPGNSSGLSWDTSIYVKQQSLDLDDYLT